VLEELEAEEEEDGAWEGGNGQGGPDTEVVDGEAEEEGVEGGSEQGAPELRGRREWPQYLIRKGDPEKVHLQRALHLLQPKVERPSKDLRYIALNYLPGFRPINPKHDLVHFEVYAGLQE
jgi:hypothetical protein